MSVQFTYQGQDFSVRILDNCSVSSYIEKHKEFYELPLLLTLESLIPPNSFVLDVGAHIGNHTLFFAKVLNCKVLAFEPNPEAFAVLETNIKANGLSGQVQAFNFAVADYVGSGKLKPLYKQDPGSMGLIDENNAGLDVDVKTLDSLTELSDKDLEISLIKLDVEGSELAALHGASRLIKASNTWLTTEVQSEDQFHHLRSFLTPLGFFPRTVINPTPTIIWSKQDVRENQGPTSLAEKSIVYGIQQAISHNRAAANAHQLYSRLENIENLHRKVVGLLGSGQESVEEAPSKSAAELNALFSDGPRVAEVLTAAQAIAEHSQQEMLRLAGQAHQDQSELLNSQNQAIEELTNALIKGQERLTAEVERLENQLADQDRKLAEHELEALEKNASLARLQGRTERLERIKKRFYNRVVRLIAAVRLERNSFAVQENRMERELAEKDGELSRREIELAQEKAALDVLHARLDQTKLVRRSFRRRANQLVNALRSERSLRQSVDVPSVEMAVPILVVSDRVPHEILDRLLSRANSYLLIELNYNELDLLVRVQMVVDGVHYPKTEESYGPGMPLLALSYLLNQIVQLDGANCLHYFHSTETVAFFEQLASKARLPYSLYFHELPDVPWSRWHYLNSASLRVLFGELEVAEWDKKFLFLAQRIEPVCSLNLWGLAKSETSGFDKNENGLRLLIVSYYMPPFRTVAMQRLEYWVREMESIAEGVGIDLRVEVVTASGGSESEKVTLVPDFGLLNCEEDLEMQGELAKLAAVNLNHIGVTWTSHLKQYFTRNASQASQYDAVLMSGNPFYYFELSSFFASLGAKVILDFRDPFAHNPRFSYTPEQLALVEELEDRYLRSAELITAVNEHCLGLIGTNVQPKTLVVSNGFDESAFSTPRGSSDAQDGRVSTRFVYAGTFYPDCSPIKFISALTAEVHEFVHIGREQSVLNEGDIDHVVVEKGLMDYADAMKEVQHGDAGVIFTGGKPFEHTTKIFDYIAADIDVVIVTEGEPQSGEIHNLTKELDRVFWVRNERAAIEEFLSTYVTEKPTRVSRESFSRRYQTQKLLLALRDLCGESH